MKKREYTESSLEAMSNGGKQRAKPVITPHGEFPSVTEAAIFYGLTKQGMMARCKSEHWEGFQYKEKGQ